MEYKIKRATDENWKVFEKYFAKDAIGDSDVMRREGKHRVIVKSQADESDSEIYDVNISFIKKSDTLKMTMLTIEENSRTSDTRAFTMTEEVMATAIHEIKNPLFAIRGYAQLLHQSFTEDDNRKRYTTLMLNEIDRLHRMTETFLRLGKKRVKNQKKFSVNEAIEEVIKLYGERLKKVKFEKQEQEEYYVNGDRDQLKQVFINLLENALDAVGDTGELKLKIYSGLDKVIVELKDNGPGIKKDDESRVFNAFFTTKIKGTGLGLYICKKIVEEHMGSIDFSSEEGKGTTFFVELPLAK